MSKTIWDFIVGKDQISATVDKIVGKTAKLQQSAAKSEAAFNGFLNRTGNAMGQWYRKNLDGIQEVIDEVPALASALKLATNPIALGAAVGGLIGAATKAASFEKSMAKVNVTAQLSKQELSKLSNEILNTGRAVGLSDIQQAPEAFNKIISAGLNVEQSMKLLQPTLLAAKAGFTDIEIVADAAVSTINSSGITDSTKIFDILFATLNKGKAEFADIATYLPKIIPDARAVGIELTEVSGAFAYLSGQGFKAESAANRLQNVFKALGDTDRIEAFKKIGVNVFDAGGNMRGLLPIVKDLAGALDGLNPEESAKIMSSLGLDTEAQGAISSMTQDLVKLEETMSFVTNSAGQFDASIANAANVTDGWNKALGTLSVIVIKLGQVFLPPFNVALTAFNYVLDTLYVATEGVANLLSGTLSSAFAFATQNADILLPILGATTIAFIALNAQATLTAAAGLANFILGAGVAAIKTIALTAANWGAIIATKAYAAAQWLLNAALTANPVGLVVAAIAALSAGIYIAYQRSDKFRAVIAGIGAVAGSIMPVIAGLGKAIGGIFAFNPVMALQGITQAVDGIKGIATKGIGNIFSDAYDQSLSKSKIEQSAKDAEKAAGNMTGQYNNPYSGIPNQANNLDPGKEPTAPKAKGIMEILDGKSKDKKEGKTKDSATSSISSGISGDGNATKNITITIQKLVENITIQTTNLSQLSTSEVKRAIEEVLIRAVRDAEIAF